MLLCVVEGEEGVLDAGEELGLVLELPVAEAVVVGDEEGHEAIEGLVEPGGRSAMGEGWTRGRKRSRSWLAACLSGSSSLPLEFSKTWSWW